MTKSYFTPSPIQAPLVATGASGLKGYAEYLLAYDLYFAAVQAAQAKWKQSAKDAKAQVRVAAERGTVVKRSFLVKENTRKIAGLSVVVPSVEKVCEEVPAKVTPAKAPEAKHATKVAKRRRNRENRKLRKAKKEAVLSLWQVRARKNGAKLAKMTPVVSPTRPGAKGKAPVRPAVVESRRPVEASVDPHPERVESSSARTASAALSAAPAAPSSSKKAKASSAKKKDFFRTDDEGMTWAKSYLRSAFQIDKVPPSMMSFLKSIDWKKPGSKTAAAAHLDKTISEALARNRALPPG